MSSDLRIAALVPMRHQSERISGKNYRSFCGSPLFYHILFALQGCSLISEVVIDTDSETVTREAAAFPRVRIIERPVSLRGGGVSMNAVLQHDVSLVPADFYVQTHSTNPLLRSETITEALQTFLANRERYDSLFAVTPLRTRLWTADGKAVNHDPQVLLRTQDLEPIMVENSCLYVFDRATLERTGNRIGARPLLYPIEREEAWDIDEPIDWSVAEALFTHRSRA